MLRLTWRHFAAAILIASIVALVIVLLLRVTAYYRVVLEVAELEAKGQAVDRALSSRLETLSSRIDSLEREVFGGPPPKAAAAPVVVLTQPWQKNRDAELRKRITALEQWRLRVTQ